jgi:hypothetical protein
MWFTLVLRSLGAYQFIGGLSYFVTALNAHLGYDKYLGAEIAYLNHGVEECVIGAVLLLAAARISAIFVSPLPSKANDGAAEAPANV